jgi:hypothetical protein
VTESVDSRRLDLVRAAQQQWIAALTDLGGRNTLLYYKDRRASTLDLARADPEAMERFTGTGSIRLTRLFKDVDLRADAIRRMQAIHRKARELVEERGIRAGYLATGMVRWDELFLEPAAPVLLRRLTITPTRARYDDAHCSSWTYRTASAIRKARSPGSAWAWRARTTRSATPRSPWPRPAACTSCRWKYCPATAWPG